MVSFLDFPVVYCALHEMDIADIIILFHLFGSNMEKSERKKYHGIFCVYNFFCVWYFAPNMNVVEKILWLSIFLLKFFLTKKKHTTKIETFPIKYRGQTTCCHTLVQVGKYRHTYSHFFCRYK